MICRAFPSLSGCPVSEHADGNKAYLTYKYAGQVVGKASIKLEETTEQQFEFSETESGENTTSEGPKYITVNLKVIFMVLALLIILIILVVLIRNFYEKNRAKIRKAVHIYQKRRFLRRKRSRRRKRR